MKRRPSIFLTLGFVILTSCSQSVAPDSREADARALRESEIVAFVKDWGGNDVDRIAAHYADDGNPIVPNSPMMTDKAAIGKAVTENGRLVAVFRREANGTWKAVQDINNPEAAAMGK